MIRNYLKSALRNLLKSRMFTLINVGGLSLGISVAILILLYVQNELNYDKWIPESDRIYRVYRSWNNGGRTIWTPDPLAEALTSNLPEVEQSTGVSSFGETLLDYKKNKLYIEDVAAVDSTYFGVVELSFLYGNPREALNEPNSVVISKRISDAYFGNRNPVGEVIRFNGDRDYTIQGVLDELEGETHLNFEVFSRFTYQAPSWTGNNRSTYIKVVPGTKVADLEEKITELATSFITKEMVAAGRSLNPDYIPAWKLQPFGDVHLKSEGMYWFQTVNGNIKYVYIFSLIAIIVLIIASINYINLSTAKAAQRAKEVGIRKVVGGQKRQLIAQFLTEASLQTLFAMVVAIGLAELFLPWFNQITDRELAFLAGNWTSLILPLIGLAAVVSLMAGCYPAFLLSSFQPMKVIKGTVAPGANKNAFRRTLVVFQFTASIILIIVMTFIYRQVNFMMEQDLGFNGDQVVAIPLSLRNSKERIQPLKDAFLAIPGVESISTASNLPGGPLPDWIMQIEGDPEERNPNVISTDFDFAKTLDLEIVQGRFFSPDHPTDTIQTFVVNEAFARRYNIDNILEAKVKFTSDETYSQIIGVVKDFHYRDLEAEIRPVVMRMGGNHWQTAVKVSSDNITSTIAEIRSLWPSIEPEHPMRYSFLDEDFAAQYGEHQRFGQTLLLGTILTIFIAILGLFGLAVYSAARRTKEIGIRKVLGASVQGLTFMLVKDFVRWIVLASVLAVPVGYLLTKRWLQDFAYATDISAGPFIMAIVFSVLIAILTVSFQAIRATTANPVDALKDE